MEDTKRVAGMLQLTELIMQKAQADLATILARENALRKNLQQLVVQKPKASSLDPAYAIIRGDVRWQQWVDQRQTVINAELAQVLALKENANAQLQQSHGRHQAVTAMHKKLAMYKRQNENRRISYES